MCNAICDDVDQNKAPRDERSAYIETQTRNQKRRIRVHTIPRRSLSNLQG